MLQGNEAEGADTLFEGKGTKIIETSKYQGRFSNR